MKLLAMEFTSEFIHIFHVDAQKSVVTVERSIKVPMPQNCYSKGMLVNNDRSVSDLILNTLKEKKIKEKKVVVSISNVDCLTEEFSLPQSKPKVLGGMVEQELQKKRKLSNQNIYDYVVLGPDPLKEGFVKIKAVICPKSLINNYHDVIKKSGLIPMAIDFTNHAMEYIGKRSSFAQSEGFSILACIDRDEMHFVYSGGKEEPYYRHAFIKQDNMLDESMFVLSANNKFNFGKDANDNTLDTFIENITKLTRFHSTRHPDVEISSINIYGDYEDINLLCDRVQNSVGIRTVSYRIANSVTNIRQKTREEDPGNINVLGTVLALTEKKQQNFEFFKRLNESKQEKNANLIWVPSVLGVVLFFFVIAGAMSYKKANDKKQEEIDAVDAYIYGEDRLETYYKYSDFLGNIDECYAYNERAEKLKQGLDASYHFDEKIVKLIDSHVIEGVKINSFSYSSGKISLSCVGDTETKPAEFTRELLSLEGVLDVQYSGFVSSVSTEGERNYSFSVIIVVDKQEEE